MIKITALYGHPQDDDKFEQYYHEVHLPLVDKTPGIIRMEFTRFLPNPDGSAPAYYRMAELYFSGPEEMQIALSSAEGQMLSADLPNFATGGVSLLFGTVEL